MNDRLYRSRNERMLAGVAGGVAEHFDIDPSLVRVLWAVLVIVSGGIFLLIYIVMAIVVPEEPGTVGGGAWSPAGSRDWVSSWPAASPSGAGGPPSAAPGMSAADPGPGMASPVTAHNGPDPAAAAASTGAGFAAPISGGFAPSGPSWPEQGPADARRAARDARRAARRTRHAATGDRPGSGGLIAGLILVALGLFFLVRMFVPQIDIDRFWPAGLILFGVILVALSVRRTPGGNGP